MEWPGQESVRLLMLVDEVSKITALQSCIFRVKMSHSGHVCFSLSHKASRRNTNLGSCLKHNVTKQEIMFVAPFMLIQL